MTKKKAVQTALIAELRDPSASPAVRFDIVAGLLEDALGLAAPVEPLRESEMPEGFESGDEDDMSAKEIAGVRKEGSQEKVEAAKVAAEAAAPEEPVKE